MTTSQSKFAHLVGDTPDAVRGQGRPTKYEGDKTDQRALRLALLNYTDAEIAKAMEISESTLNLWKLEHPSFSESLNAGKDDADAAVANSLFLQAKGVSFNEPVLDEEGNQVLDAEGKPLTRKVHVSPNTAAQIFWLKNRQGKKWRDKQNLEHTGADGKDLNTPPDATEIARRLAFLLTVGVNTSEGNTP